MQTVSECLLKQKKIQNLNVSGFPINNAQTEWAQIKMPHATVIPS